jgi:hypothetical protein
MPFEKFDRNSLLLKPLKEREHDLDLSAMLYPDRDLPRFEHPSIAALAEKIVKAKKTGASVIFMMGAHVIRAGAAPLLIDLMKKGYITHFALNGAGAIHDFEFALIGATTESVAKYLDVGQFGLWEETGRINEAAKQGMRDGLGLGEAIGRIIQTGDFPHRETSLLAAGYRMQVPVTVHVGIGCDIIHEHPNCDGAALGKTSYTDFLICAHSVSQLEGGVFLNFGSAVIGPEVFLKCLSMARNAARQQGKRIEQFTTAVFDLLALEGQDVHAAPPKSDPRYYFRPWKTIMARAVAQGGESYYIQGQHRDTVSALHRELTGKSRG